MQFKFLKFGFSFLVFVGLLCALVWVLPSGYAQEKPTQQTPAGVEPAPIVLPPLPPEFLWDPKASISKNIFELSNNIFPKTTEIGIGYLRDQLGTEPVEGSVRKVAITGQVLNTLTLRGLAQLLKPYIDSVVVVKEFEDLHPKFIQPGTMDPPVGFGDMLAGLPTPQSLNFLAGTGSLFNLPGMNTKQSAGTQKQEQIDAKAEAERKQKEKEEKEKREKMTDKEKRDLAIQEKMSQMAKDYQNPEGSAGKAEPTLTPEQAQQLMALMQVMNQCGPSGACGPESEEGLPKRSFRGLTILLRLRDQSTVGIRINLTPDLKNTPDLEKKLDDLIDAKSVQRMGFSWDLQVPQKRKVIVHFQYRDPKTGKITSDDDVDLLGYEFQSLTPLLDDFGNASLLATERLNEKSRNGTSLQAVRFISIASVVISSKDGRWVHPRLISPQAYEHLFGYPHIAITGEKWED